MISMTTEKKKLYLSLFGIFFVIFILNSFMVRSAGDDYVYSFMWEGHSMYEPLSAGARRIGSISDIVESLWSHFFTWGGRIVAHFLAMFFLWMPRGVFDVVIGLTTVLLVLLVQWMAYGGKVTMQVSVRNVLLSAFCIWTLQTNFVGVFIWLVGSCNYLFPVVFLLIWLLPYIRHYMTDGAVKYGTWMTPGMFWLGLLAGNGNENTICWIGLSGFFYLLSSYRKGRLSCWMFTGFVGLAIGYLLLMLSPGNLIRAEQSKDTFDLFQANAKALVLFWANTLVLSYFYFYLLKGWRKRKLLAVVPQAKKYMHLSGWFILQSFLFEGIMYFSPEFPLRSIFPCTIFCIVSTFIMHRLAQQAGVRLTPVSVARNMKRIAVVYFCLTFMMSCWLYIQNALWFQRWEAQALALQGTSAVLEVTERPPYEGKKWSMLTGVHAYEYGLMEQQEDWKNVAFARFYHIGGVTMIAKEDPEA